MSINWKPNPNAAPYLPSKAYYNINVPCCPRPLKIRKKGLFGRLMQWVLIFVLFITVVVNIMFILDTTARFRNEKLPATEPGEDIVEDKRSVDVGKFPLLLL